MSLSEKYCAWRHKLALTRQGEFCDLILTSIWFNSLFNNSTATVTAVAMKFKTDEFGKSFYKSAQNLLSFG
jgi:hypothetical protein